VCAVK